MCLPPLLCSEYLFLIQDALPNPEWHRAFLTSAAPSSKTNARGAARVSTFAIAQALPSVEFSTTNDLAEGKHGVSQDVALSDPDALLSCARRDLERQQRHDYVVDIPPQD